MSVYDCVLLNFNSLAIVSYNFYRVSARKRIEEHDTVGS